MLSKKKTIALVLLFPLALSISSAVAIYLDIPISVRKIIAFVLAIAAFLILALIIILLVSPGSSEEDVEELRRENAELHILVDFATKNVNRKQKEIETLKNELAKLRQELIEKKIEESLASEKKELKEEPTEQS